jgi:3-oxoacyl-[acyl-carrier protein] reductase
MYRSENTKNIKGHHSNILIFGGSGITGDAIARKFGQQGWSAGIHYHRNRVAAEETSSAIQTADGEARLYQANIDNPSEITNVLQSFLEDYGSLNVLLWAVGIAPSKLLSKTSHKEWGHTLRTNLTGAFHVLREAWPLFEQQQDGTVILIRSLAGEQGMTGQTSYAASKAGLMGLMQTTAKEWGNWNIRVNAIFPGWHASPLSASGMCSALSHQTHVLHRTPSLNHVAASVYHLALAKDVSGQVWNLDSRIW